MNRRTALKGLGIGFAGAVIGQNELLATEQTIKINYAPLNLNRPIDCIVIGAGNRGNTYARYATIHPDEMRMVGVSDILKNRRDAFAINYKIEDKNIFKTWEDVFKIPKFADVVIISTPDRLHYGAFMKAIAMGYHILVEKPMAVTQENCEGMRDAQKRAGTVVAVCHVLRYTPYFRKLKKVIASGNIGDIVSINHLEPVGYWHMAHSYVRGNWRNIELSSPIILAKSSHDLDILRWLIDKPCTSLSASGSLVQFKSSKAPIGSTMRCTEGCAVEKECPYSALKLYLDMKRSGWPVSVITDDLTYEGRLKAIREGQYGRCVYHCDNNQPDHMVMNISFGEDIHASFTMSGFTAAGEGRHTRIMGTMGEIVGDMYKAEVRNFRTGTVESISINEGEMTAGGGHGGGDYSLVRDFLQAVDKNDPSLVVSGIADSVESHVMAFRAESSRLNGGRVEKI